MSGASAQTFDRYGLIVPPMHFASGPYLKPPALHRINHRDIQERCVQFGYQSLGCTILSPATCDIYIRDDLRDDDPVFQSLLSHEQAHCRGWPADHPDWPVVQLPHPLSTSAISVHYVDGITLDEKCRSIPLGSAESFRVSCAIASLTHCDIFIHEQVQDHTIMADAFVLVKTESAKCQALVTRIGLGQ